MDSVLYVLAQRGIDPALWVEGSPVTLEYVRTKSNWLSWALFARLMRRYEELVGADAAEAVARSFTESSAALDVMRSIAGLFVDIRWLYWFVANAAAPVEFPVVGFEFERLAGRRLRITATIPDALEDSPEFFRVTYHCYRVFPTLVGAGLADVTFDLQPRRAVFDVDPPASMNLPHAQKALRSLLTLRSLSKMTHQVDELAQSLAAMDESNRTLKELSVKLSQRLDQDDGAPSNAQDHLALAAYHTEMARLALGGFQEDDEDYRNDLKAHYERSKAKNPMFSLRSFARKLGLSPAMLSNVLSRKRDISLSTAVMIARRLGYSPAAAQRFYRLVQQGKFGDSKPREK